MYEKEWIDVLAESCQTRKTAIRIMEREGLVKAIEFLERVPGINVETLKLMKREYGLST